MDITIIIPHFRTGKMTAYAVSQYLKFKGSHNVFIIVGDNKSSDGSIEYLKPFSNEITIVNYPEDRLQSHGIVINYILSLGLVKTDIFLTVESDSYPIKPYLDYYDRLCAKEYDSGGSLLKLSGGEYIHGCGAFYKQEVWQQCEKYCNEIEFSYFPNMNRFQDFDCHLMVHNSIVDKVTDNPGDWVDLAQGYVGLSKDKVIEKARYYKDVVCPFHNGMGMAQESIKTFGNRNTTSEVPNILMNNKHKLVKRIGYEPSQFFTYWQLAMKKGIAVIPTEIKWMRNRGSQQQEYTLTESGIKHEWGISAYFKSDNKEFKDVVDFKNNRIEVLYNSLPENQKIKL